MKKTIHLLLVNTITLILFVFPVSATEKTSDEAKLVAPDFLFSKKSGESFYFHERLEKYRKPALLYFWATWCPYCRKATPRVVALNQKYSGEIDVLAINVGFNDSIEKMENYKTSYGMNFPVMFDANSHVSNLFYVSGTPVFVIVSAEGEIIYRSHQYPEGIEHALTIPKSRF